MKRKMKALPHGNL
uniref:Uncharacterized protein n=1 Tax=Rhizophora mucronata TaxID=61149 RepID=A0A2P2PXE5_RHIMU